MCIEFRQSLKQEKRGSIGCIRTTPMTTLIEAADKDHIPKSIISTSRVAEASYVNCTLVLPRVE
eukprot:scaffold12700_cov142-Skeletonema_menzelii.AAC.11